MSAARRMTKTAMRPDLVKKRKPEYAVPFVAYAYLASDGCDCAVHSRPGGEVPKFDLPLPLSRKT